MAKARKVTVVRGVGTFVGPHRLQVGLTTGDGRESSGEKKSCVSRKRSSQQARNR